MNQFLKATLLAFLSIPILALAAPETPTGLCVNSINCTEDSSAQAGLFPGTSLKFHPGFVLAATENQSLEVTESRWQALFRDRKQVYLPKGIYSGVVRRLNWKRFYDKQYVRPENPEDHTDPAYNWKPLDDIFTIYAVKNEGELV